MKSVLVPLDGRDQGYTTFVSLQFSSVIKVQ